MRRRNGDGLFLGGSRRRQLNLLGNGNQTSHRFRNRSLVGPIGGRRRWNGRRGGVLPLVHLFSVGQLGRSPPTTAAQAPFVGLNLGPEDGQFDLLVIYLGASVNLD